MSGPFFLCTVQASSWSFCAVALVVLGTLFVSVETLHLSCSAMAAPCGGSVFGVFVSGMAVGMFLLFGFGCW